MDKRIGEYSFIIGVILAVILGIAQIPLSTGAKVLLGALMVVMGLIVGFLNVTGKETKDFLLVATVLVIAASMGSAGDTLAKVDVWIIGSLLKGIFQQILAFVVPALVVVCLKEINALAKNS